MKEAVFWDVTSCNLVDRYQRSGGNFCFDLQGIQVKTEAASSS
jgi:hypothetical protein